MTFEGIAVSQSSPDSTTPLPHTGWQSGSLLALPAGGQQPSAGPTAVIGVCEQVALQVPAESSVSVVHELLSLQSAIVGHLPAPLVMPVSQVSPASTTPLPQVEEQSTSVLWLQPEAQQPSLVAPEQVVIWV